MSEHRPGPRRPPRPRQGGGGAGPPRQAEDLLRRGGGRRQDVRDAGGGARAARRRRGRGRRLVETHGRAETEALLERPRDPAPPRRRVPGHHAARVRPRRRAARAAPPSSWWTSWPTPTRPARATPSAGRTCDELLDAGIDVYTTLNVQHLESLNDVVAQITGVVVRETVPDSVLEQADEVELIDLPPDDLLQRLREGKVYVAGAGRGGACENFFRKGNLIALRELALRRTAERVDAQMRVYRREHAIDRVVADGRAHPGLRRAQPLLRAAGARGPAHGRPAAAPSGSPPTSRRPAQLRLPPEANATASSRRCGWPSSWARETVTLSGPTMSEAILAYARDRNVSKIVVGKPTRSRWRRMLLGSIVDALVRGSGDIDVYVISGEREGGTAAVPVRRRVLADRLGGLRRRRSAVVGRGHRRGLAHGAGARSCPTWSWSTCSASWSWRCAPAAAPRSWPPC